MHILVTGANGQLGSELRELSSDSKDVFLFTDVQELDLCDKAEVFSFFESNKVDVIINCAAYTAVDKAETDAEIAQNVNAMAVKNLVDAALKCDIKLIHVSTDYVFNGQHYKPWHEEDVVSPLGVYGYTKREGENYLLESYVKGVVIRTSWLYSSYGNNFVKTMMRLGKERSELGVIFDQIGTPTYAKDLAEAILHICQHDVFGSGKKLLHYSNEGVASWYDFAKAIMEIADVDCEVKPIETKDYPTPAARPFYSVMNKKLIKEEYAITIPYWRDALKKCIAKIKEN
ncbi:dTDP-4-dehydrorhamnose reductase [Marinilabiliaceae bacterium JC017]|nr:dTDP-4-dehydrorhamnose reductase [Marinilabiliaceae bacterium JC017]